MTTGFLEQKETTQITSKTVVDAHGLLIAGDGTLNQEAWEEVGRALGEAANGNAWAIGDWLVAGARLPGNNFIGSGYAEAHAITGLSIKSLGQRYIVATKYPRAERVEGANWTMHHISVRIKNKADRIEALNHAVDKALTCEAFKNLVTGKNAQTKRITRALREVKCPNCAHEFMAATHKVLP